MANSRGNSTLQEKDEVDPSKSSRSVSLTCKVCKVLEDVVQGALGKYFVDNGMYTECKNKSCVTQLEDM